MASITTNGIRTGDLVEDVSDWDDDFTKGKQYIVTGLRDETSIELLDDGGHDRFRPAEFYRKVGVPAPAERFFVVDMAILIETGSREAAVKHAREFADGTNKSYVVVPAAGLEAYRGVCSVEKFDL